MFEKVKTSKELRNMREIQVAADLPEGAAYYWIRRQGWGNLQQRWTELLDSDLNIVESVKVRYTNAISGLTQVKSEKDLKDEEFFSCGERYTEIGKGFYKVEIL